MVTQIGVVAGEILVLCEGVNRPLTVTEIEFYLGEPYDTILMSLGWLAREGFIHIAVDREGEEFTVERLPEDVIPVVRSVQHRFEAHF